jgi:hypothetical protein
VTPTCTVQGGRVVLAHNWGSLTHPHPQNSGCPSVVLWTPCSGVEWRVFEPHQGLEKLYRTDVHPRTSYFFLVSLVFLIFLGFLVGGGTVVFLVFSAFVFSLMYLWYSLMVRRNAGWAAAGTIFFSWSTVMVT